jgi:hypothetical protein
MFPQSKATASSVSVDVRAQMAEIGISLKCYRVPCKDMFTLSFPVYRRPCIVYNDILTSACWYFLFEISFSQHLSISISLRYLMYIMSDQYISYLRLIDKWWGFNVNMILFWRVYQVMIIHHRNFQNFDLSLIYVTFHFTLEIMGRARSIQLYRKEILFSYKSLGRKLYTFY